MSRDDSRELTRKSTRCIFVLHLAELLAAWVDRCRDSETPEGQANPKENREWRAEL